MDNSLLKKIMNACGCSAYQQAYVIAHTGINEVWGMWVYENALDNRNSTLWSLHKTKESADKAMKITGLAGFAGRLPIKD